MNCGEFIDILKSGQPILLRRHSKEYIRLSENSLSVTTENGVHLCLWLAASRHFKRIIRSLNLKENHYPAIDLSRVGRFRETLAFLYRWEEMRTARDWSPHNFPGLTEIATFVYLTLIPEYWMIYLEVEGKPAEEALPLVTHEKMYTDIAGYDG
jgi:hypothetical protein